MSKFFESLEEGGERKPRKVVRPRVGDSEESEEEKETMTGRERRLAEVQKICREHEAVKTPKETEQFFKKLVKLNAFFAKEGVPDDLLKHFEKIEKKNPSSLFKQKKGKFLEKYDVSEVIIDIGKAEARAQRDPMEQINKCLLIEDAGSRKSALLELEAQKGLSGLERHRINLYLIAALLDGDVAGSYFDIIERLKAEASLLMEEEELNILKTRIGRYVRRLVKHIQHLSKGGKDWAKEFAGLEEVASVLLDLTTVPLEGCLEISHFLQDKVDERGQNFPWFQLIARVRSGECTEDELLPKMELIAGNKLEEGAPMPSSEIICYARAAEELGQKAFHARNFDTAISLLEPAYFSRTMWSTPQTETMLGALCICFELKMKERPFFQQFQKQLSVVGRNPLLLKSEAPKEELARAFILLRLGEYEEASTTLSSLIPDFDPLPVLRAKVLDILISQ